MGKIAWGLWAALLVMIAILLIEFNDTAWGLVTALFCLAPFAWTVLGFNIGFFFRNTRVELVSRRNPAPPPQRPRRAVNLATSENRRKRRPNPQNVTTP